MKLIIGSLSLIWLVMAVAVTAQEDSPAAVLDTSGQPLERGVEYYINPAITDNGGRFTLIDRNNSCPLYAGQENVSGPKGYPVTFAPFEEGENVVRETKNFKVAFSAFTICAQSTAWKVGEQDPETKRRLIVTGDDGSYSNYFYISKEQVGGNVYRQSDVKYKQGIKLWNGISNGIEPTYNDTVTNVSDIDHEGIGKRLNPNPDVISLN